MPPKLVVLTSTFQPLLDYVFALRDAKSTRHVVAVIPDLVVTCW